MKKLLLILSLSILFVSCHRNKKGESSSDSSEVVAKINGTKITLKQFSEKLEKESRYNPSKYQTPESKKELLDEMVNNELLFQEAKKRNLENEESIKQMMVRSLIRNYIKYEKDVKDDEINEYYNSHPEEFEEIKASHILIKASKSDFERAQREKENDKKAHSKKGKSDPALNAATFEEYEQLQLKKAEDVVAQLKKGANFEQLADKYSEGPTKTKGGDLGYFTKNRMIKEFTDVAFNLKNVGDISGVVKTKFGFHIIKLTDRRTAPLDKQKTFVKSKLLKEKRDGSYDNFVKDLAKKATIKINEEKIKEVAGK